MSHDKIKAAARKRMAETGRSYAAARRQVREEFRAGRDTLAREPERFAIRHDGLGPVTRWLDTLRGGGAQAGRIEINDDCLRLRMADFRVDVPRASVREAARSSHQARGTIGVHASGGRWLVNGSADGLVAITIDPPCRTPRGPSTLFRRMEVNELIVSLADPDSFIAAVSHWLQR